MAHIAMATTGMTGILYASFEMVRRLESEGHRITYLCPLDVRDIVEAEGFQYVQLPPINFSMDPLPDETILNKGRLGNLINNFKTRKTHYSIGQRRLHFDSYRRILDSLKVDMALIDVELHEVLFSAYSLKIKVYPITQWFDNIMRLSYPPIMTDIIPGQGFRGSKIGILYAWMHLKARIWGRTILNRITFTNNRKDVLYQYAKQIGFPTKNLVSSNFPPYFIYRNIPVLSMTMGEMEFPHRLAKNLKYTGPMVYVNRKNSTKNDSDESRLSNIFSSKKNSFKKLLYCSLSTHDKGDINFIEKLIRAITPQEDWILIITLGGKIDPAHFTNVPEHIHLFRWVPQLRALQHADCSINHGGIHSINECMHFEVPMLIYSGKLYDQNGCAARVVYHGLGLKGDKDIDSEQIIRDKINKVLHDDSIRSQMKLFRENYSKSRATPMSTYLSHNP